MRPLTGDDAFRRSRTADHSPSMFGLPSGPQMTYFLADESAINSSPQPTPISFHRSKDGKPSRTGRTARTSSATPDTTAHGSPHHDVEHGDSGSSNRYASSSLNNEPEAVVLPAVATPLLRPSTAVSLSPGPSGPASAMSSASSRRGSFSGFLSDDLESHSPSLYSGVDVGTVSVGDDEVDTFSGEGFGSMMDSGCAPQLVMPSIKMPSRRPFTAEGKRMGRLKVLIAGDSGVGKTSLIKAIVQSCEHIVHVDPITQSPASSSLPAVRSATRQRNSSSGSGRRQSLRAGDAGTSQITEIYASTKPYPEWWSEVDDFDVLQRRKSLGDSVLDRNICFVDTPGYGSGSSVRRSRSRAC